MSSAESAMYRIERKASPPVHAECRIKRKASQTVHAECRIERKTPVHAECRTQCGVSRHRTGPSIRSLARSLGTGPSIRSEEHTSELQSLMRISYAVFCLKKKKKKQYKDQLLHPQDKYRIS